MGDEALAPALICRGCSDPPAASAARGVPDQLSPRLPLQTRCLPTASLPWQEGGGPGCGSSGPCPRTRRLVAAWSPYRPRSLPASLSWGCCFASELR